MPSINLPARSFRFFWKLHTICWFKKILLHSTYNIRNFFLLFCYFRLLHVCLGVLYILQLSKNFFLFHYGCQKTRFKKVQTTRRRRTTYIRFFVFSLFCVYVYFCLFTFFVCLTNTRLKSSVIYAYQLFYIFGFLHFYDVCFLFTVVVVLGFDKVFPLLSLYKKQSYSSPKL